MRTQRDLGDSARRRRLNAIYIGVNLLVDVLYAYLNPKIRYSS